MGSKITGFVGLVFFFLLHLFIVVHCKNECINEPRCRVSRMFGMKGADCYQKDMRHFPQCLSSDIEIIDLSYNRIRKIHKKDLTRYSDLKMLYLSDNMIISIDDEAVLAMDEVTTIDLSMNALQKLPPVIFQLPSLKSLYLGQNLNMNIVDAVESAKPISSPLGHLDISYLTDDEPIELPDFGLMPNLIKLNISGNWYMDLTPKQFAGLCSLHFLENINVTVDFVKECDCWLINRWLKNRNVLFVPFQCNVDSDRCFEDLDEEDVNLFSSCSEKLKQIEIRQTVSKYLIISGVIVLLILIIAGIYIFCMRKSRRNKKESKNKPYGQLLLLNNQQQPLESAKNVI